MDNIAKLYLGRLKLNRSLAIETAKQRALANLNPAITATFIGTDPNLGLAKTIAPDGSVGYQRQINNIDFSIGDVIPATLQGNGGIGFIDGLNS